jgi:predicted membrane-bound spermidine synthase
MSIPFRFAMIMGALSGFIALAYEIVWSRIYSFVSGSNAQAFGMLLGSYLFGLALGSLWSRRWQDAGTGRETGLRALSCLVVLSNLVAFFVIPIVSWMVTKVEWPQTLPAVIAGSALLGAGFPLLCHLAIPADHCSGARLSYLYLANIIGSGLGSLLTGLVLTDWLPLRQIAAALLVMAVVIGIVVAYLSGRIARADVILWAGSLAAASCAPLLYSHLFERLQYKEEYFQRPPFIDIVECRHGVITVDENKSIFGNGSYDGMLDTDPRTGGGLFRPLFLSALHPAPREVLVIGVSGGAWTKVIAHNPDVEMITAVEISEGYIRLIGRHPEVSGVLTDPKIRIVIDDGRRWLRRNPGRHFDAIVMNTQVNWREFSSALLSREFLELARSRLKPGGLMMWNCTSSPRAFHTGMTVFPYTATLANFCIGSMSPIDIDPVRWRHVLTAYQIDGRPIFDLANHEGRASLEDMISIATSQGAHPGMILTREQMKQAYGTAEIITDDNLGHEYKFTLKDVPRLKKLLFWPFH